MQRSHVYKAGSVHPVSILPLSTYSNMNSLHTLYGITLLKETWIIWFDVSFKFVHRSLVSFFKLDIPSN